MTVTERGVGPRKKQLLTLVRCLVLAIVAWGIWHATSKAVESFRDENLSWKGLRWQWLAGACMVYGLGLMPMACFWRQVLRSLGQAPTRFSTVRAYYIGHLGKYVPGKAMVVVLRAGLLDGNRVDRKLAAISVFVETLTMMAVGALLALVYVLWAFTGNHVIQQLAGGLMLFTLFPTLPPVFRRLVVRLKLVGPDQADSGLLDHYTLGLMAQGWIASGLTWCLLGVSLSMVLRSIPFYAGPLSFTQTLPLHISSTSLAMVAGFLSLLPGGVLVREWVLDQLLSPSVGQVVALSAAVLLRLVWLVTEVVVSVILYLVPARSDG